jgi:hypothetical protein
MPSMTETSDLLIFWVVVAARFFVPLLIPRYPLPAILAALIIDAADQTIFQQFTNLDLEGYQGYDKALDIYYLTIAYISTLRNWTNLFAFQVSRFLFYWRLVGVVLFELLHLRPLLMIFPNTFEYFFIFYEAVRLRWDPKQMTKKFLIGAAAFIWIFIKLPQEYWIHIAQLDTTDFIKQTIFGMPTDTPWSEILAANLWVIPVLAVVVVLILVLARWILRRLPPADWGLRIAADPVPAPSSGGNGGTDMDTQSERFFNAALLEKIVMVSLVSIIFAQVLPGVQASNLAIAVGVAFVIIINTVLSHWLARRGTHWTSALREFVVMAAVNFGLVLVYSFLLPNFDGSINLGNTLFFVLLLTLLVTLFDRYRQVHLARFANND